VDSNLSFKNCNYAAYDGTSDGNNDSVNLSFNVTSDYPTWCGVTGKIIDSGNNTVVSSVFDLTVPEGRAGNGYLLLSLPHNQSANNYTVNLTLTQKYPDETVVDYWSNDTIYLHPYSKPIADFHWSPLSPYDTDLIYFYDDSTPSSGASINSWNWSFGDGNYSGRQNTSHQYADDGTYNVTLLINDTNGLNDSKTVSLNVKNKNPYAFFSADITLTYTGDAVTFNSSTSYDNDGTIVNWTWNFGDGTTSYLENPTHTYNNNGFYTVKLIIKDDDGAMATNTKTGYISIYDALVDDSYEKDTPGEHKWDTIQEGIDDVGSNDKIYVFTVTYNEDVNVNKSICLYGENRDNVVINGNKAVVNISNSVLYMNGFKITSGDIGIQSVNDNNSKGHNRIVNCHIHGNTIGVLFDQSSENTVQDCNVSNNNIGIKIINESIYNVITRCNIYKNNYGVYIEDSTVNFVGESTSISGFDGCSFSDNDYAAYLKNADGNFILGCDINATPDPFSSPFSVGIYLDGSTNNTVSVCKIYGANDYGVYQTSSENNKIEHCKLENNGWGVYLSSSSNNLIVESNFTNSSYSGVHLLPGCNDNSVFYNDFINNGGIFYPQAYDAGNNNIWYKEGNVTLFYGGGGEGNHWSNYNGNDDNSDGIGDTPYNISGPAENTDDYPVMDAYGWGEGW
jgi:parallel beta-helix repeat protein